MQRRICECAKVDAYFPSYLGIKTAKVYASKEWAFKLFSLPDNMLLLSYLGIRIPPGEITSLGPDRDERVSSKSTQAERNQKCFALCISGGVA